MFAVMMMTMMMISMTMTMMTMNLTLTMMTMTMKLRGKLREKREVAAPALENGHQTRQVERYTQHHNLIIMVRREAMIVAVRVGVFVGQSGKHGMLAGGVFPHAGRVPPSMP